MSKILKIITGQVEKKVLPEKIAKSSLLMFLIKDFKLFLKNKTKK